MDDPDLNQLLNRFANTPVPNLPSSFAQDVLREIRLRNTKKQSEESWLSEIYRLLLKPGLLAGALGVAVVVGISLPTMMSSRDSDRAAQSLGLEVFSHSTNHLPSELLAKTP